MDKPVESKRIASSTDIFQPVERFLKRCEPLASRDSSSRRSDAREQIIEEQIEEYKKKREKVLGNQSVKTFTVNEMQKEIQEEKISSPKKEITEKEIIVSIKEDEEKEKEEEVEENEKVDESQENINNSTKEYVLKLPREKLKWEEAKQKKENLQNQESDETCTEGNLEKLMRILGEDMNLQVTSL